MRKKYKILTVPVVFLLISSIVFFSGCIGDDDEDLDIQEFTFFEDFYEDDGDFEFNERGDEFTDDEAIYFKFEVTGLAIEDDEASVRRYINLTCPNGNQLWEDFGSYTAPGDGADILTLKMDVIEDEEGEFSPTNEIPPFEELEERGEITEDDIIMGEEYTITITIEDLHTEEVTTREETFVLTDD